jgi:iron-sulfur cluster assembly protein
MVILTQNAADQVRKALVKRGKGIGLRLGVRTVGCSGLAYHLDYAEEARPEDVRFESNGVTVLVDSKSLPYVDGTTLDFVREGLGEKFKFDNPNVKGECGCGESFSV